MTTQKTYYKTDYKHEYPITVKKILCPFCGKEMSACDIVEKHEIDVVRYKCPDGIHGRDKTLDSVQVK